MTDQPTQPSTPQPLPATNPIETGIDTAIKDGEQVGAGLVETAVETKAPLFAFPIIKQLFESFVSWLFGVASKDTQIVVNKTVNQVEGNVENSNLAEARAALQAALQSGDANAIAIAKANFQKAQSALVNNDGLNQPQS